MHETQEKMHYNAVLINRSVGKTSKQDSQNYGKKNGAVLRWDFGSKFSLAWSVSNKKDRGAFEQNKLNSN